MRKIILSLFVVFILIIGAKIAFASGGFDQFGYNYSARIFSGLADGADRIYDGNFFGVPTLAKDRLIMKWNAAWDSCNTNPSPLNCKGAWTDYQWNGKVMGGSGQVWHYKTVWIGDYIANPKLIPAGAKPYGDRYALIMDQGSSASGHTWVAGGPTGHGVY